MDNNKEESNLNKKVKEKKAVKEDTSISMTYILIILAFLIALLTYIYFFPQQHSPTKPVPNHTQQP